MGTKKDTSESSDMTNDGENTKGLGSDALSSTDSNSNIKKTKNLGFDTPLITPPSGVDATSPKESNLNQDLFNIKGSTTDIMKALAICLLSDKLGTDKLDVHNPILNQFIILDYKAARLGAELNDHGDLSKLRDTAVAGVAKLATITQQPQAKQLAVVYREQLNAPEKSAAELIQSKIQISKLLNELIQAQQERVVKLLVRTLQTNDMTDEPTKRELYSLSQDLSGITLKIHQFTSQQNATKEQLESLAKQVLAAIPAAERTLANLPDPDSIKTLTNT